MCDFQQSIFRANGSGADVAVRRRWPHLQRQRSVAGDRRVHGVGHIAIIEMAGHVAGRS
jgi:hypothetical protein